MVDGFDADGELDEVHGHGRTIAAPPCAVNARGSANL